MRKFRKVLALLLLVSVALLPVTGLASGFDTLKSLIELPISDDVKPAEGFSIYDDVDADTSKGVLCMVMYGENGEDSSMIISGINDNGKFEVRMYSDLDFLHTVYYSYLVSKSYNLIQAGLPSGASYFITITLSEDNTIFITDASEASEFADKIQSTIADLANN